MGAAPEEPAASERRWWLLGGGGGGGGHSAGWLSRYPADSSVPASSFTLQVVAAAAERLAGARAPLTSIHFYADCMAAEQRERPDERDKEKSSVCWCRLPMDAKEKPEEFSR